MAITFVGSDSGQHAASTATITLTLPTHQADDFAIIYIRADEAGTVPDLNVSTPGWTELADFPQNPQSGRDRVETFWYRRFTSSSETNPVCTISISEEMSASVHVFRGVDTLQAFDATPVFNSGPDDATPINSPISTNTDSACLVLFQGSTHNHITTPGVPATPTGLVLGESIHGAANDHRGQQCAYKLDVGAAGTYTPTAWTHTVSNAATAEWSVTTLALRAAQPVGVIDIGGDDAIDADEQNVIVNGFGFEASQGTGILELADGPVYASATKVTQTIDSWSDTQIQFDTVDTGLPNDSYLYVFVTNDSGDRSGAFRFSYGLPPYDLVDLAPDHYWTFNNVYDDETGGNDADNVQGGTVVFAATSIVRGSTHALHIGTGGTTDSTEPSDSAFMNTTAQSRRAMGGWFMIDSIQQALVGLYEEGGGVNNICLLVGFGNSLMISIADTSDFQIQAFSDVKIAPNRVYHVFFRFSGSAFDDTVDLFVDGVLQTRKSGSVGATDLDSHSANITFGEPESNLDVGGTDILFRAIETCLYSHWASWSGNNAQSNFMTDSVIRETIFETGCNADVTISSDTEANMQIALDALADTLRPDAPCCIRVGPVTGGGDFELTADNITFDPKASIHVQFTGTTGTLTWINTNGSDASIESSPYGTGAVTFVNPPDLTLSGLQNPTEVRVYDAGTQTEIDGQENVTGGTFSTSIDPVAYPDVDISVLSLGYQNLRFLSIDMTSGDVSIPVAQRVDRQYENT